MLTPSDETTAKEKRLVVLRHIGTRQLLRAAIRIDSRRLPEHATAIHLALLQRRVVEIPRAAGDAERRSVAQIGSIEKWRKAA